MWILSWMPDWIFHLITLAGVLGIVGSLVLGFIPFVSQYKLPIQVASVLALVLGVFMEGAISNESAWKARVQEMQVKVAQAEAKAAEVNTKVITKIVEREKIIKENTNANVTAINKYVTDECRLSNVAVVLHNSSSQNELPPSTIDSVRGTSEVKTGELLTTVTENYGLYYELVNRLKAWQDWYKEQKQIFEDVK